MTDLIFRRIAQSKFFGIVLLKFFTLNSNMNCTKSKLNKFSVLINLKDLRFWLKQFL